MRFENTGLSEPILRSVSEAGYETTTPIQAEAIPPILAGKDVLGCAETGTGKTAAFALPILQQILEAPKPKKKSPRRIRSLVLSPTRELAQQIYDSFQKYGRHTGIRHAVIFGGVNQSPQVRRLRSGIDVLIATPGRLLDLMNQRYVRIDSIDTFVLDEADRMLDMGFLPDIRRIIARIPEERQTLFFSATMPRPIRVLSDEILRDAVPIQVAPRESAPTKTVNHFLYHVEKPKKLTLLTSFLENNPYSRVLVFTRAKHAADKVVWQLGRAGLDAVALHGNKSQAARTRALASFRSAKTPILVATDIASRGLDVDDISHVINYDLTHEPETYIHRVGRTGRAGKTGIAVSFCTTDDYGNLRAIERLLDKEIQRGEDPPGYTSPEVKMPSRSPQKGQGQRRSRSRNRGGSSSNERSFGRPRSEGSNGRPTQRKKNRSKGRKRRDRQAVVA